METKRGEILEKPFNIGEPKESSTDSEEVKENNSNGTNTPEGSSKAIELAYLYERNDPLPSLSTDSKSRKKRKNYTAEEDSKIMEGVKRYGGDWSQIVKWACLERTPTQIKDRFRRLVKKDDGLPTKYQKIGDERTRQVAFFSEELEREKKRLEEFQERLTKRQSVLDEKEEKLKQLEHQLARSKQEAIKIGCQNQEKVKKLLIELLTKNAQIERQNAKKKTTKDRYKLGEIVYERHGTTYLEHWQDGQLLKDLSKRHEKLLQKKDEIEKARREVQRKIKNKLLAESTLENIQEIEELYQQEDIWKIKLNSMKKEEMEVEREREKLLLEKNIHIRELKRIHDEEQSRFNNFPVLENRYLLLSLLGKGGFSEVYKAFDLQELEQVACKIHQLNTIWSDRKKENYVRHACREYKIHKSVVHPRIVKLFDVFEIDENSFCTVLEYCSGSDLDFYLKQQNVIPEREAKSIIAQIFSGLSYLNQLKRPIIHYDLKPGNILFSDEGIKITDFGLSKIMEENQDVLELTSQGAGTYWYLPPECFEVGTQPPKISSKVDVWSVGVIFYQMLYGKKPFGNNLTQQKILSDNVIQNSVLEFPAKPVVSKETKDFIRRCLSHSPAGRPDVKTCYNDPYFKFYRKEKRFLSPPKWVMPPPEKIEGTESSLSREESKKEIEMDTEEQ